MKPLVKWHIGGKTTPSSIEVLIASINKIRELYGKTFDMMICINDQSLNIEIDDVEIYRQNPNELTRYNCPAPVGPIWKLTPPAIRPYSHELTLDNDLILLRRSKLIEKFLDSNDISIMAESNNFPRVYGRFVDFKNKYPSMVNSGVIGVPPSININELFEKYVQNVNFKDGVLCPITNGIWIHEDIQGLIGNILNDNSVLKIFKLRDIPIFHAKDEPIDDISNVDGIHFVGINRDDHRMWRNFKKFLI
jgi:hypothetical protein